MANESSKNDGESAAQKTVSFNYIKSTLFRVIHVDGAIGGVTPSGKVHLSLYSERAAIPQQTTHEINQDGILGEEILDARVSKVGIVRDIDVDLMMDRDTAESIYEWFGRRLKELDENITATKRFQ